MDNQSPSAAIWVTYQQPVHALRETFGFRKAYAEGANALP